MPRARTLRGRLAWWYGAILSLVLVGFSATVYLIAVEDEAQEQAHAPASLPPDTMPGRILLALAIALPGSLALAVGGGWWIARRALAPLDEVARVADELGADQLDRRIALAPEAPDEVSRLARALNAMLDRLERSMSAMRRFTADASHELRTPLAALMGEIEVTLRRPRDPAQLTGALEAGLEELGRLSRLVDSLLTLARSDNSELPLRLVDADVTEVARRALDPYEAVLAARHIGCSWRASGVVRARIDPLWLGRAIANLIDNACKFTPEGGRITVEVQGADGHATIVVSDSGPGFTDDERARLFERFYRGSGARAGVDGFGLGLALAREIVRALGGEISATARAGAGAEFRVQLPAG